MSDQQTTFPPHSYGRVALDYFRAFLRHLQRDRGCCVTGFICRAPGGCACQAQVREEVTHGRAS